MNVRSAAKLIGCSAKTVGTQIRRGKITATKISTPLTAAGFVYDVSRKEVNRYIRDTKVRGNQRKG